MWPPRAFLAWGRFILRRHKPDGPLGRVGRHHPQVALGQRCIRFLLMVPMVIGGIAAGQEPHGKGVRVRGAGVPAGAPELVVQQRQVNQRQVSGRCRRALRTLPRRF